jgi:hypothetical protein
LTITQYLLKVIILFGRVYPINPYLSIAHAALFSASFTIMTYLSSNPMTTPMILASGPLSSPDHFITLPKT